MRVLIAGANGHTGRILARLLLENPEHDPVALIRSEDQADYFQELGVETVLGDLEEPLDPVLEAASRIDAFIFAAGSGSKTGPEKTLSLDRDGAIRSIAALEAAGIQRYLMLSSMRADPGSEGHAISHYLRAKGIADAHLRRSDLAWTVVRPGRLTQDPGTGQVAAASHLEPSGDIPREDVARVMVRCLDRPETAGLSFDLLGGDTAIDQALDALAES
jgi:uncharacterized protein YbjT (DUF2867 family)